jgi:hypothetical protein
MSRASQKRVGGLAALLAAATAGLIGEHVGMVSGTKRAEELRSSQAAKAVT